MKTPSGRPHLTPRWRAALSFAAAAAALLAGALLLLNYLVARPDIPAGTLLSLVFLLALVVLGFSLGALGYVLRASASGQARGSLWITLGLAYGLPLLVFIVLSAALRLGRLAFPDPVRQFLSLQGWFPGQPWMFIWQALILAFAGAPLEPAALHSRLRVTVNGLLGGLFLGLAAAFVYSLQSGLLASALTHSPAGVELPAVMRVITLAVAILAAPWAEERFFRRELPARLERRLGPWPADLLSAGLFAFSTFRPLLFLPAFLSGIALARLARSANHLRGVILAHAVLNIVLFGLGWQLVF